MAKHNGGLRLQGGSGSSASADVLNSQTACDLGYDWKNGRVHASTTGSQYGIYDMSGGAWEYVMGVQKDSNGNVQKGICAWWLGLYEYDLYFAALGLQRWWKWRWF